MLEQFKRLFIATQEGKIKLNQKVSIFFFCLALSTFFWFLSSLSKEYQTNLSFKVNYESFSGNFILTEKPLDVIEGEVSGSGYELLGEQMSLNRSAITINYSDAIAHPKSGYYYVLTKNYRQKLRDELNSNLSLGRISPDTIFFKTEKRSNKTVPVIVDLDLNFEPGYRQRGEIVLKPSKIKVFGPTSTIDSIQEIHTKKQRINGLKDSVRLSIDLKLPKENGSFRANFRKVEIVIPVEKYTEKKLSIPISVIGAEEGSSVKTFPASIEASFLVPLSLYEKLSSNRMKAVVDIREDKGTGKLNIKFEGIPDYAIFVRSMPNHVEYIIRK